MEDLSLHVLDLAENAVRAKAKKIDIEVLISKSRNRLTLTVKDNGQGMDQDTAQRGINPFYTTKSGKRFGLGLALLAQSVQETGGRIKIFSRPGHGTRVKAVFKLDHPDLKPLGNMAETLACLIAGNQDIRVTYHYQQGKKHVYFDSKKIMNDCGDNKS